VLPSYHYLAPSDFSEADADLVAKAVAALRGKGLNAVVGSSWTTDAPFRETAEAIAAVRRREVLAVEMEAAALYAFAQCNKQKVLCLAHVTNTMAQTEQDFEKGEAEGTVDALPVLDAIISSSEALL
jgi:purine-nucleoside phosphorylase